jgi:hypothetical protein
MNMRNSLFVLLAVVAVGMAFATGNAPWDMLYALYQIKYLFCTVLPLVMMVAFMLAALVYAAGQMASADQRARFHGWATSLIIGAVTAGVIYMIGPWLIGVLLPGEGYAGWATCAW